MNASRIYNFISIQLLEIKSEELLLIPNAFDLNNFLVSDYYLTYSNIKKIRFYLYILFQSYKVEFSSISLIINKVKFQVIN